MLKDSKNSWLGIAELNLERRTNQEAIVSGKEPVGLDGDDSALLEVADLRLIVLMYHREGSQDSLLRWTSIRPCRGLASPLRRPGSSLPGSATWGS